MKPLELSSNMMSGSVFTSIPVNGTVCSNILDSYDTKDRLLMIAVTEDRKISLLQFDRNESNTTREFARSIQLHPGTGDEIVLRGLRTADSKLFQDTAYSWLIKDRKTRPIHDPEGFEVMQRCPGMTTRPERYNARRELAWDINRITDYTKQSKDDMEASILMMLTMSQFPYTVEEYSYRHCTIGDITRPDLARNISTMDVVVAMAEISDCIKDELGFKINTEIVADIISSMFHMTKGTIHPKFTGRVLAPSFDYVEPSQAFMYSEEPE